MKISKFEGFNVSGFCKCEFVLAGQIQSVSFPDENHQVMVNLKSGISWNEIQFTVGTVSFASTEKEDDSGRYYQTVINLVNPSLTGEKAGQFKFLEERDLVFVFTDVSGLKYLVGTPEFPARVNYKLNNPATGRNERQIVVSFTSDEEPYFVVEKGIPASGAFSSGFSDGFDT